MMLAWIKTGTWLCNVKRWMMREILHSLEHESFEQILNFIFRVTYLLNGHEEMFFNLQHLRNVDSVGF